MFETHIMFYQLIALALIPLFVTATPTPVPGRYQLYCFIYEGGFGVIPNPDSWSVDHNVTQKVCHTLSSGKYLNEKAYNYCEVADYDVQWFVERCKKGDSQVVKVPS